MAIEKRDCLPPAVAMGSSADGASAPSQTDPFTGTVNTGYTAPVPADRLSTVGGLDSQLSRDRGSEATYRQAQRAASGIVDGGAGGARFGRNLDDELGTTGSVADGYDYRGIGPAEPMVSEPYNMSDDQRDTGQGPARTIS
ncbi:MAG: hypothetical protein ACRD1G_04315 [Acidimicrobiales bacterium]